MRVAAWLLCVLAFAAGSASAQTQSNPVVEHFRAYRAAVERGDLDAAETAAAAALAASEARDGDGGRTAVLAANLAQIRLDLLRDAEAAAPAQRALALAEAHGEQAGVDPIYARLLLGRAELSGQGDAGQRRLLSALAAAESQGGFEAEIYDAASALGRWAIRQRRYPAALQAYDVALRASAGESDGQKLARAEAHIGRGVAQMHMDTPSPRGETGTRLRNRPALEAAASLAEAVRLARPAAAREAGQGPITRAQRIYATALAMISTFNARAVSLDWPSPLTLQERSGFEIDLTPEDGLPTCAQRLRPEPMPQYPSNALFQNGVGAVVVRVTVNDAGEITDAHIAGVAGGVEFANAVSAVYRQWRLREAEPDTPPCGGAAVSFVPITFIID